MSSKPHQQHDSSKPNQCRQLWCDLLPRWFWSAFRLQLLNEQFVSIAAKHYEDGGVVAAVCHGPAALLPIVLSSGETLLSSKSVTGFTREEEIDFWYHQRHSIPTGRVACSWGSTFQQGSTLARACDCWWASNYWSNDKRHTLWVSQLLSTFLNRE